MSREVCGICWVPYIDGKCGCKPEQEPVANLWQHSETGRTRVVMPDQVVTADATWFVVGPLFTHPPRREQPERKLTDEVIADLWHQNAGYHHHFAHAIERWLRGQV